MKMKKYLPWFIGPHGENEDLFEKAVVDSVREHCFWRRNFYTRDSSFITEADKTSPDFLSSQAAFKEALTTLNLRMKESGPIFTPRYAGHMISDPGIPAMTGHMIGLMYNCNNTAEEVSSVTLQLEKEAVQSMVKMVRYPETSWGYFTNGGSLANLQCLWRARDLRLYPYVLAMAYTESSPELKKRIEQITLPGRGHIGEIIDKDLLSRLTVDEVVSFVTKVIHADQNFEIFASLRKCSLYNLNMSRFVEKGRLLLKDRFPTGFKWLINKAAHYSIEKSLNFLGFGRDDVIALDWDYKRGIDAKDINNLLDRSYESKNLPLALVGIFGTTEIGSLDDFGALVELRNNRRTRDEGDFWLHADAAWGGYFLTLLLKESGQANSPKEIQAFMRDLIQKEFRDLPQTDWEKHSDYWTQRFFQCANGIEQSDSITIDPHKAGYIPYAAGVCLFKNYIVREIAPYSFPAINARERDLTDLQDIIWYVPHMAVFTAEGSRPCTGAVSAWLMQKSVPLDCENHGILVGKSVASAILFEEFLNQQIFGDDNFSIRFIFLTEIPLTGIIAFTLEIKFGGATLSLRLTNKILTEMYNLTVISPELQLHDARCFVTKTTFSANMYAQEIRTLLKKSVIPGQLCQINDPDIHPWQDDNKLVVLRSVFMSPFSVSQDNIKEHYHFILNDWALYLKEVAHTATKKILNMGPSASDRVLLPAKIGIIEDNVNWNDMVAKQLNSCFDTFIISSRLFDEGPALLKEQGINVAVLGGSLGIAHPGDRIEFLDQFVADPTFKGIAFFTHVAYEELQDEIRRLQELRPDLSIFYLGQPLVESKEELQFLLNRLSEMVWRCVKD